MTVKIDGTNGVLQAYDYQVLTTGFTYTFAAGTQVLVAVPAGTLATGTVTMPSAPADGMVITIQSSQQITALTLNGNAGQTVVGTAVQIVPNQPLSWVYRLTDTTWYPMAGGAGRASSVVIGTSVASTSGTSIDFTSLPAWVKKITISFSGVSTSSSSAYLIQLGTGSATYTTSGYAGSGSLVAASGVTTARSTAGLFLRVNTGNAITHGQAVITLLTGNTYSMTGTLGDSVNDQLYIAGSSVALAAALTAIRVTTVTGTDTFDAGNINILYE